jgi:hypothetical protein
MNEYEGIWRCMEVYGCVWINESGREKDLGIEPIAWTCG